MSKYSQITHDERMDIIKSIRRETGYGMMFCANCFDALIDTMKMYNDVRRSDIQIKWVPRNPDID